MRLAIGKSAVLILLGFLATGPLSALDIYLAPVVFQDESGGSSGDPQDPARDLARTFADQPLAAGVAVHELAGADIQTPQTLLDAAKLCESQGYPFLLYGFVKRTEYSYYAEIKLMERDHKDVDAAFISADDLSHYDRLINDLAAKISSYVQTDLGMSPARAAEKPSRNLLAFPVSVGYWTPMGGPWSQSVEGLVSANAGVRFIPTRPLFHLFKLPGFLVLGVDLEYQLGSNQPAVENFFLHTARIRLPVEGFLDLGGGHRLGIGLGPMLEIDTMAKSPLYAPSVVEATVAPGASASLLYQYVLSNTISLELSNNFDITFYATPLLTYAPRVAVEIWLGQAETGGGK